MLSLTSPQVLGYNILVVVNFWKVRRNLAKNIIYFF